MFYSHLIELIQGRNDVTDVRRDYDLIMFEICLKAECCISCKMAICEQTP